MKNIKPLLPVLVMMVSAAAWACGTGVKKLDGDAAPDIDVIDGTDQQLETTDDLPDAEQDPVVDDMVPEDVTQEGYCGDGFTQTELGEECDDGEENSDTEPDACRTNCLLAHCGDGVTDMGEECDDGDNVDNNECSNDCVEVLGDLCNPCAMDSECGREVDLCSDMPDGRHCTMDCSGGVGCPYGFTCEEILSGGIVVAEQCFPESGSCAACYDPDGDRYGIGPECLGVDCDEEDPDVNPGAVEICDGKDNNCIDGIDEGFPLLGQACDGPDSDLCENGTYTCTADGLDVECVNETAENIIETCNGADDDCDGDTDEDFPLLGQACDGDDSDLCENGTYTCTADGADVECVNETISDIPETCNNLDDDCDGSVDEDNPGGGVVCDTGLEGICSSGVTNCTDGFLECVPDVLPGTQPETCNGLDDDCNGLVDDLPDLVVSSSATVPLSGIYEYGNVTIAGTVTVEPYDGSSRGRLELHACTMLYLTSTGQINAYGAGYRADEGPGAGGCSGGGSDGGGYGGAGGAGIGGSSSSTYGSSTSATIEMGSGGGTGRGCGEGTGGSGGGAVALFAPTITLEGTINADGTPNLSSSDWSPGGGAGGGVLAVADTTLSFSGTIYARGGTPAAATWGGGGGGGGRVKLIAPSGTNTGTINVSGGAGGSGSWNGSPGAAGSVYVSY